MKSKNRVGLGTFPLAGVFDPITQESAKVIVQEFIKQGGYYIDTAPLYGNGKVEEILGEALNSFLRKDYYLISKVSKVLTPENEIIKGSTYIDVITTCEDSLRRLKTNYLDLCMVHSPDPSTPFEETMRALNDLKKDGKVLDIAVSNVNLEELKAYNKYGKVSYVQNRFSLINRSIDLDFEKYLLDNNIHLIPYHLLEIGLLTGIAFENYKLRDGDLRLQLPYWSDLNQKVIFEWVRNTLAPIAKSLGITIGQLNIAWALKQKFIDFVVVGTTNSKYLSINLAADKIELDKSTLLQIEGAYVVLENIVKTKYKKSMREFRGLNEKYY